MVRFFPCRPCVTQQWHGEKKGSPRLFNALAAEQYNAEHLQIEKDSRSFEEVFADQRNRLVYLTADSEQEVEALSTDDIYIVGLLSDLAADSGTLPPGGATQAGAVGQGLAGSVSQHGSANCHGRGHN